MDKQTAKKVFIFVSIAYFFYGSMWSSIGPLLSQFATVNQTTLAIIGGIYSAIFIGAILSQVVLGPFSDRIGLLRTLVISLLTLAIALIGVTFSRWLPLTFFLAFVAGMGQGLANLAGNVLAGQLFPEKSVTNVNLLNFFWGVGATLGPMMISGSLALTQSGFFALYICAGLTIVAALILMIGFFNVKISKQQGDSSAPLRIKIPPFLLSMGFLILLYVGIESAMGGWATTYIQKTTSVKIEIAALVTAGFWLAITLGRMMGTFLGSHMKPKNVLILCLAISSLGTVLFVSGYGNGLLSIAAIFLIGLGFGAIYPTCMAVVTSTFSETPGQSGVVVTLMGSIGGMLIPWLQGVLMEQAGIRSGTYLVAALVALLIASFAVSQRFAKKEVLISD
jgi:fucose permease